MSTSLGGIKSWIAKTNVFRSDSQDHQTIQIERISSWIFIPIFTASIIVLLIYSGFGIQNRKITLTIDSYTTFESLYKLYPNTLNCPCSIMSIPMSKFIQATPHYHQVSTFWSLNFRSNY